MEIRDKIFRTTIHRVLCFLTALPLLTGFCVGQTTPNAGLLEVAPGIWRLRLGTPESITAVSLNPESIRTDVLKKLTAAASPEVAADSIIFGTSVRGCTIEIPMTDDEQIYGFGVHLTGFNAVSRRHNIVVSDQPEQGDGSGHAPVPFYVSTRGYGVFVDTLRYARFYCGNLANVGAIPHGQQAGEVKTNIEELYRPHDVTHKKMVVDVPVAQGVDVYLFNGPTLLDAVRRYVLFSGGGVTPPLWGLGVYYRGYGRFDTEQMLAIADYFRQTHIPCSVLGLEPGWHTQAYSCSFLWSDRFPQPNSFIQKIRTKGFHLNLWEQAFVHPTAPFYEAIRPHSGNYQVWNGVVPDFTVNRASEIFTDYHQHEFVRNGVTGFKLDECDNQPYSGQPWSFPEFSRFPSGMDGEQMHSVFGLAFQRAMTDMFRRSGIRTWGQVRSSHALAAAMPFVLYSDAYNHRNYVRGLVNMGFSGLLWQPEVRTADNVNDLYRRIQTAVFSPQTLVNAWFIPNVPWHQFDEDKNKRHQLRDDHKEMETAVRQMFNLRMRLVPYLYAAFNEYRLQGIPPFRALVMDYPDDKNTYTIDDAYMVGPSLLAAPLFGDQTRRSVYLPRGKWYCFWTQKSYDGGHSYSIEMPNEKIPLFVKDNTLLALAEPVEYICSDTVFELTVYAYGDNCQDATLFEDDGESQDYQYGSQNRVVLKWNCEGEGRIERSGSFNGIRYRIKGWEKKN